MKKPKIFKKTFYCPNCGSKMAGVCDSPIYDSLTGKLYPYLYKVRCPNYSDGVYNTHVNGNMYSSGKLSGR